MADRIMMENVYTNFKIIEPNGFSAEPVTQSDKVMYIPMSKDNSIIKKVCEWFPSTFLLKERVFAIQEVEPTLLKLYTRAYENINRIGRQRGGKKVMLLGQEVFGDTFLACGRCGYHSSDNSNVRKHHRRQICLIDRGYNRAQLHKLSRKERTNFLQRLSSRRYRERCRVQDLEKKRDTVQSVASIFQSTENTVQCSTISISKINIAGNIINENCRSSDKKEPLRITRFQNVTATNAVESLSSSSEIVSNSNGSLNISGDVSVSCTGTEINSSSRDLSSLASNEVCSDLSTETAERQISEHLLSSDSIKLRAPETGISISVPQSIKPDQGVELHTSFSDVIDYRPHSYQQLDDSSQQTQGNNKYDPVLSSSSNSNENHMETSCPLSQQKLEVVCKRKSLDDSFESINNADTNHEQDNYTRYPVSNFNNTTTDDVDHGSICLVSNTVSGSSHSNLCIISMVPPGMYKSVPCLQSDQQKNTTIILQPCDLLDQSFNLAAQSTNSFNSTLPCPDNNQTYPSCISKCPATNVKGSSVDNTEPLNINKVCDLKLNNMSPVTNCQELCMQSSLYKPHCCASQHHPPSSSCEVGNLATNSPDSSNSIHRESMSSATTITTTAADTTITIPATIKSTVGDVDIPNLSAVDVTGTREKVKKKKGLSLGPVVDKDPIEKVQYDLYTISDSNQRMAWKPVHCHKSPADGPPCHIAFRGARRSRRCLSLPVPCLLLYRKLDCRLHHCHFTLFHPHARLQQTNDNTVHATVQLRVYADTVMTQSFHHYLRSLLFSCRLKPSQAARHISGVWSAVLRDRVSSGHSLATKSGEATCKGEPYNRRTTTTTNSTCNKSCELLSTNLTAGPVCSDRNCNDSIEKAGISSDMLRNKMNNNGLNDAITKNHQVSHSGDATNETSSIDPSKHSIDSTSFHGAQKKSLIPSRYRSITSLSKQTVKSLWRRLEEEEESRVSDSGRRLNTGRRRGKTGKPAARHKPDINNCKRRKYSDISQQPVEYNAPTTEQPQQQQQLQPTTSVGIQQFQHTYQQRQDTSTTKHSPSNINNFELSPHVVNQQQQPRHRLQGADSFTYDTSVQCGCGKITCGVEQDQTKTPQQPQRNEISCPTVAGQPATVGQSSDPCMFQSCSVRLPLPPPSTQLLPIPPNQSMMVQSSQQQAVLPPIGPQSSLPIISLDQSNSSVLRSANLIDSSTLTLHQQSQSSLVMNHNPSAMEILPTTSHSTMTLHPSIPVHPSVQPGVALSSCQCWTYSTLPCAAGTQQQQQQHYCSYPPHQPHHQQNQQLYY